MNLGQIRMCVYIYIYLRDEADYLFKGKKLTIALSFKCLNKLK